MRIAQEGRTIYIGAQQGGIAKTSTEVAESLQKGRVFGRELQLPGDKMAKRRKEAQEKAMKVVKGAFAGELKLDESVAKMKESITKTQEEMVTAKAELNKVLEREAALAQNTDLTDEEYEQEMFAIEEAKDYFSGIIADGKELENKTMQALGEIKIERAKSAPMVEATENAEKILEAAGEDIIGMLREDAKEHIDAENEKKQEEAEEKAEKEKELEERIKAKKAEKEEKEEDTAPEVDYMEAATKQIVKLSENGETVQKELQHIVDRLKLDLEDLKGATVDAGV